MRHASAVTLIAHGPDDFAVRLAFAEAPCACRGMALKAEFFTKLISPTSSASCFPRTAAYTCEEEGDNDEYEDEGEKERKGR